MLDERPTISAFERDNAFLSNFHPAATTIDGIQYPTSEHAFQAMKTLDQDRRRWIAEAPTPAEAKRRGRSLQLRPGWDTFRIEAMRQVLAAKFSNPRLLVRLLATQDALLIEGNRHGDRFWGQVNDEGTNWLGRLLMELRDTIREQMRTAEEAFPRQQSLFC